MEYKFDVDPAIFTAEWHNGREAAHHIDERTQAMRILIASAFIQYHSKFDGVHSLQDLGCGDGGLLETLKHLRGNGLSSWGYDLSPKAVEFAKGTRHVEVEVKDFINDTASLRKTDMAVMTEVLEHLQDPHGFLRDFRKADWIIASSPVNETPASHYEFHVWAWDMEGYANLFKNNGWQVVNHLAIGPFQVLVAKRN